MNYKYHKERQRAIFKALCRRYENRCLACGKDRVKLTRDHVIPRSHLRTQPRVVRSNIQPLCDPCNRLKGPLELDFRPFWDRILPNPSAEAIEQCVQGTQAYLHLARTAWKQQMREAGLRAKLDQQRRHGVANPEPMADAIGHSGIDRTFRSRIRRYINTWWNDFFRREWRQCG
jgi:hypothetical protein